MVSSFATELNALPHCLGNAYYNSPAAYYSHSLCVSWQRYLYNALLWPAWLLCSHLSQKQFCLFEVAEYFLGQKKYRGTIWTKMNQAIPDWICFSVFQMLKLCFPLWCFPVRLKLQGEIWVALLLEVAEIGKQRRKDYTTSSAGKLVGDLAVLSGERRQLSTFYWKQMRAGCC